MTIDDSKGGLNCQVGCLYGLIVLEGTSYILLAS